jgi:electron transfer flavoprotein beta subunit
MRIFVCVKQVPAGDSLLRVDGASGCVDDGDFSYEMNESDAYALEEALQLKEKHGGEVVAISAGPARAASTIREALAKGADRGVLIEDDNLAGADAFVTARALAAALRVEEFDLVLTGLQSDDAGFGQTGVVLAELLGLPHATLIVEVQAEDGKLRVKRELEAGWFQYIGMDPPALLTIQSGINKVRYATLLGIKKARNKPLTRHTPSELGIDLAPMQTVQRVYVPAKTKQTVMIEGSADEAAKQLIEKLKFEARVL